MNLASLNKFRIFFLRLELLGLLKSGIIDIYQPLPWLNIKNAQRYQSTLLRWQAIETELGDLKGSALDIGCHLGFFTFQMARKGVFCIGVEGEAILHHLCNLIKEVGGFEKAVFVRGFLDESFSQTLPTVDITLFLSVFHHMIRKSGMEQATRLMKEIMQKTRRVIFFETGQANEPNVTWAKHLPPMDPNPKEWTERYFCSMGASRVKYLGEYETHLSKVKRSLFAVYLD
jgi:hypothetical protein